jgi:PTH1 family peptidyl-tRNA hydrolase
LVIGLGNPGPEYARTRHNVGAMAVDLLAERLGGRFAANRRTRADVLESRIGSQRVLVAKPNSFMNESGGPVAALTGYFDVAADRLIVLHDELDLAFGATRVKFGGGDNGHNGLKSLRKSLATGDWYRVRIGIGRPPGRQDPAEFVLKAFASTERDELPLLLDRAVDAVESLLDVGLERTQERFNAAVD